MFSLVIWIMAQGNVFKIQQNKFRYNRRKLFLTRRREAWNKLPREAVESS